MVKRFIDFKLFEVCDELMTEEGYINFAYTGAIPFTYLKKTNDIYFGKESRTHHNIYDKMPRGIDMFKIDNLLKTGSAVNGRIYKEQKIISFWYSGRYSTNNISITYLKKILTILNDKYLTDNIFENRKWRLDITLESINSDIKYKEYLLDNYFSYKIRSQEILTKKYIKSIKGDITKINNVSVLIPIKDFFESDAELKSSKEETLSHLKHLDKIKNKKIPAGFGSNKKRLIKQFENFKLFELCDTIKTEEGEFDDTDDNVIPFIYMYDKFYFGKEGTTHYEMEEKIEKELSLKGKVYTVKNSIQGRIFNDQKIISFWYWNKGEDKEYIKHTLRQLIKENKISINDWRIDIFIKDIKLSEKEKEYIRNNYFTYIIGGHIPFGGASSGDKDDFCALIPIKDFFELEILIDKDADKKYYLQHLDKIKNKKVPAGFGSNKKRLVKEYESFQSHDNYTIMTDTEDKKYYALIEEYNKVHDLWMKVLDDADRNNSKISITASTKEYKDYKKIEKEINDLIKNKIPIELIELYNKSLKYKDPIFYAKSTGGGIRFKVTLKELINTVFTIKKQKRTREQVKEKLQEYDVYGSKKPIDIRSKLNDTFNHPSEIPEELYEYYLKNLSSILTQDATDLIRWCRILGTEDEERYDDEITIYRAVEPEYKNSEIREGDWVSTSKEYAEQHNDMYFDGKGEILEKEVNGEDVLVSPTGDWEEAIYAPLKYSKPYKYYRKK